MKFQLNVVISGEDSLDEKLKKAISHNENFLADIIRYFLPSKEESLNVESFSVDKISSG